MQYRESPQMMPETVVLSDRECTPRTCLADSSRYNLCLAKVAGPRLRVDLTQKHRAEGGVVGGAAGGASGGCGRGGRCGHGKLHDKCRECRDGGQAGAAQEQRDGDGAEQEGEPGGGKRARQRQRVSAPQRARRKCERKRQRSRCKDCGGAGICQHNRRKSTCKDCGGTRLRGHQHLPA